MAVQMVSPMDALMTSLAEGLVAAEQKVEELAKDFGPEDPQTLKAAARVKDYQQRLGQRVQGFIVGLDAKVASIRASIENLNSEVERAKNQDLEIANRGRPYRDARKKVVDLQASQQALVQQLAYERLAAEFSREPAVDFIEQAVPPTHPSTNRGSGAVCMALGLLSSIIGIRLAKPASS